MKLELNERRKRRLRTDFVIEQGFFKVGEVPFLVCSSNSAHTFYVSEVSIFDGEFVCENGGHVFRLIAHHTMTQSQH